MHAILVLHNDVISNRLNPATYQILKMIDEKFVKAGRSVWDHVIVGYSKCNAFETSWRSGLEGTKKRCARRSGEDPVGRGREAARPPPRRRRDRAAASEPR